MNQADQTYKTLKWYKNLLFHLNGNLEWGDKFKNSVNSGMRFIDSNDHKDGIDGQFNKEINIVRGLISLVYEALNFVIVRLLKIAVAITTKRIEKIRSELIETGDPRVRRKN